MASTTYALSAFQTGGPRFLDHYINVVLERITEELSGVQKETFLKGLSGVLVSDIHVSNLAESGYKIDGSFVKLVEAPIPSATYQKSAAWIERVRTELSMLDRPLTVIERIVLTIEARLPHYAINLSQAASALEASPQQASK